MSDPIHSVRATADVVRAVVTTRYYSLEGDIHFPRSGKEARRLSNMLNSDRKFIAMTNVRITSRISGSVPDTKIHPFIQVNIEAIEFVQPCDDKYAEREASEVNQSNIS